MTKRNPKGDPLVKDIERALRPGKFVSYGQSWDFIRELEEAKKGIDALVEGEEAERAVGLYELFLSACYEKGDEIDDSGGNLGSFFEELFVSWVEARQKSGHNPVETVFRIVKWMENDDYGFCHDIESEVAITLDQEGRRVFADHFEEKVKTALSEFDPQEPPYINDCPCSVFSPAKSLKKIYLATKDIDSYKALCERFVHSPQDCENIATLHQEKGEFKEALEWVDRGLNLEKERSWGNESAYALSRVRRDLLLKTGRRNDAFEQAWKNFQKCPGLSSYERLMDLAPEKSRPSHHKNALEEAQKSSVSATIDICLEAGELDFLSDFVLSLDDARLES